MQKGASLGIRCTILACLSMLAGCSQTDSEAQPQQPAAPLLQYIGAWGVKGNGPGQLDEPASIATDPTGNVYIADSRSTFIHKFSPEGEALLAFQEDALKHPQSITVDSGGAIYVTDPVRSSVFVFLPNGDRYRIIRLRTRPSVENELSVAVGDDGLIHVLDANAGKVFTYTSRFRLASTWPLPASAPGARGPRGPIAIGPDGNIYVGDAPSYCIIRLDRNGHFISSVDGEEKNSTKLTGEFAVSRSYVFAMDVNGLMLHVLTMDGKPKLDMDLAPELGQGARLAPALAVSPRAELLVLDTPEARVLRYHINF
jgi:DNA-binding beta-propeller fold protein YncE